MMLEGVGRCWKVLEGSLRSPTCRRSWFCSKAASCCSLSCLRPRGNCIREVERRNFLQQPQLARHDASDMMLHGRVAAEVDWCLLTTTKGMKSNKNVLLEVAISKYQCKQQATLGRLSCFNIMRTLSWFHLQLPCHTINKSTEPLTFAETPASNLQVTPVQAAGIWMDVRQRLTRQPQTQTKTSPSLIDELTKFTPFC